ncbi:MAG TPA: hypothetical protein VGC41_21390, partial [Kofleriaceae bacterium]
MPRTWHAESLNLELVADILRCAPDEAKAALARRTRDHADDQWLDRTLDKVAVPALCVASALAEHGGLLDEEELEDVMERQFGLGFSD